MASQDIRAWVYYERFRGMYDRATENKVSQQRSQRSQRSRSPRIFPRLNHELLAEPLGGNSDRGSELSDDSETSSNGATSGASSRTATRTAEAGPSMPSVVFNGPVTINGHVTFVSAVNFSSALDGGMFAASSSAQRIDQSPQL